MSFWQHLAGVAAFLVMGLFPLPLCLAALEATDDEEGPRGPAHGALVVLASWGVIQTVIALVLGLAHHLAVAWLLPAEALVLAGGMAALHRARRDRQPGNAAALRAPREQVRWLDTAILGSLACLGASLLWTLSVQPINEWDSLAYHLPTLAQWYQAGRFVLLEPHTAVTSSYPGGWEALAVLLLMPFREDFLAALPNLAAWVLLGLSVYRISREVGARETAAVGAAALALTIPCVADNVNTMHVDLGLGAYFMAAVYFALLYRRKQSLPWLGLCLAAAGVAIGTKGSGLAYCALPLALLVFFRFTGGKTPGPGRGRAIAVAGLCCCLFAGGFWYARNWAELGNPFAPVSLRVGGVLDLPGQVQPAELRATTLLHTLRPFSGGYWRSGLAEASRYWGVSFAGLLLLGLAALVSLAFRQTTIPKRRLLGLPGLAAAAGLVHAMTPFSGQHASNLRYAVPCYGLLAVLGAAGATASGIPGLVMAGLALAGIIGRLLALRMSFTLVLLAFAWAVAGAARGRAVAIGHLVRMRVAALLIVATGIAALVLGSFVARGKRADHRGLVYGPIVHYLAAEVRPGERIGYLACPQSYLLYGSDLRREVVYVPLKSRDRTEWVRYLWRNSISLVAAGPTAAGSADGKLLDWLAGPQGPLERVFSEEANRPCLYRVREAG